MNKQHNFISLLKNLNTLADIGNHTGGYSLLALHYSFQQHSAGEQWRLKQWKKLLSGTFEVTAKKKKSMYMDLHTSLLTAFDRLWLVMDPLHVFTSALILMQFNLRFALKSQLHSFKNNHNLSSSSFSSLSPVFRGFCRLCSVRFTLLFLKNQFLPSRQSTSDFTRLIYTKTNLSRIALKTVCKERKTRLFAPKGDIV